MTNSQLYTCLSLCYGLVPEIEAFINSLIIIIMIHSLGSKDPKG